MIFRLFSATAVLATAVVAQNGPVIGFTARSAPASSALTRQVICNPSTRLCADALPAPSAPYAGGAAYHPIRRTMWHTQGTRLVENQLATCKRTCATAAERVLGNNSLVGGLTINPARNEMYQVESIPGVAAIVTYEFSATAACPKRSDACRFSLPTRQHHAGGIAYDQKRDLIWVATSVFTPAPQNFLLAFRRGSCRLVCRLAVRNCSSTTILPAIRALAYDDCRDEIYISDGRTTSVQRVVFTPSSFCPVGLRPFACCPLNHPRGEFWAGFDLQPIRERQLGSSCTGRPCPSCPSMKLATTSDAVVGNAQFGMRIENGPKGGIGLIFVRPGGCRNTPFGCGTLYALPGGFALPAFGLVGPGPCGASGGAGMPLPNNFKLCNTLLCAQGVVLCPSGGAFGIGLTNALVIPIDS